MLPAYLGLLDVREDKVLFSWLYKMYEQPMMQAAMEILDDQGLAQDALQEAFLDIIRHFEKIRGLDERHQRGYIILVSRNKARNIYRKREGVVFVKDTPLTWSTENSEASVCSILEEIPETYQETLLLTGMEYTPAEIAEILGEKIGTIYKRLERGREILRKKLREEGYNEY